MATGNEANPTSPAAQFAQLLATIQENQTRTDNQLAEFRAEMRLSQEDAATKALKRVRHERPYAFKRKGNEEQATFNEKVEEVLADAKAELSTVGSAPALERAREAIEKGVRLLSERQKLIKIADRSDFGWGVVAEYMADELAEDSDDEKRLDKAEKAAERKAGKKKKKRVEPPSRAARSRPFVQSAAPFPPPAALTAAYQQRRPAAPVQLPFQPRAVGPCFACGEMGHVRAYCPKTAAAEPRKWYPLCTVAPKHVVCFDSQTGEGPVGVCFDEGGESGGCCDESGLQIKEGVASEPGGGYPRFWETETTEPGEQASLPLVKGRLKEHLTFWREEIKAPSSVLDIIESGYVLPLMSSPQAFSRQNQTSAMCNAEFVQQSVADLLDAGCIKEVAAEPWVCSPLSVVENSVGKKRLVVNLKHLNKCLWKQKFKYEDLRIAMLLFEKGDYLFTFDLKSGYHHVDIAEEHCKYLGFAWHGRFYMFTVLPFGLSSACYMFTKLLRPLVRYWRARGLRILVYLDDGLCATAGRQRALEESHLVQATLNRAGFVVHPTKSVWEPIQRLTWLGFVIDLALGQIEVPREKVVALQRKLAQAQACQYSPIPARQLASIVGRIISMGLAIGPVSRFMTRSLYATLESRMAWCERLTLSQDAQAELSFWAASLTEYNSQPIWHSPSALRVVYSDASDTGYGGYVVEHGSCTSFGQWSAEEAGQSSTWRELAAVLQVLQAVAPKLANTRVRWFTDNQNVARILQVGSKKPQLHALALKVFSLSLQHHIRLEPEWIPRELNERADALSRIVDYDDWFLNPTVFFELDTMWGPHSVDRFACFHNSQLPRFNSRCWNPGSEAVDAFTVNWAGENNWWCPPISLVPRVIRHAQVCGARGTLVVPCWPSVPFWPLLCPAEGHLAPFVKASCELPSVESLILPGLSGCALFNGLVPNTKVLALRCEF